MGPEGVYGRGIEAVISILPGEQVKCLTRQSLGAEKLLMRTHPKYVELQVARLWVCVTLNR
jgi:hypothetical protein